MITIEIDTILDKIEIREGYTPISIFNCKDMSKKEIIDQAYEFVFLLRHLGVKYEMEILECNGGEYSEMRKIKQIL